MARTLTGYDAILLAKAGAERLWGIDRHLNESVRGAYTAAEASQLNLALSPGDGRSALWCAVLGDQVEWLLAHAGCITPGGEDYDRRPG